jgi:crossover junction endodeoxyribonuclease RuvC
MKVFIGIDPGKDGAMAILGPRSSDLAVVPFDERAYADRLLAVAEQANPVAEQELRAMMRIDAVDAFVVVEHVNAMPGQGVTSCFSFGQNFGFILGLLTAFRIPYELVRPQKWKKEFSCTSDKNTSIEVARRLFPYADLRRTPQCRKPHDGICEALLMAEYARRQHVAREQRLRDAADLADQAVKERFFHGQP